MINRKFGIEIEFVNEDRNTLIRNLRTANIEVEYEGYTHRTTNHWKIVTDATVRGGYELVSPPLQGEQGLAEVKKVLNILHESKRNSDMEMTNRSCGLHIHLDAHDLDGTDIYWIVKRYRDNETTIDNFMPPSRRGNYQWCSSIDSSWRMRMLKELNTIEANARQQMRRACKVNVAYAYARHKTIEFRHHSGTTDYNKIANWIEFLQYFVAQSIKIKQAIKISHNYKPRKKNVQFPHIREQVASLGGRLFWNNRDWILVDGEGASHKLDCNYLVSLYTTIRENKFGQLNKDRFNDFIEDYFPNTNSEDADESLFAGIPHYVQEFFRMRTAQLQGA